ncbi:unnamed protein product [Cuscuta campestris]|uniref:Uncharacterized protein n=1 Tax=Cuscuta campestris TaxID=132261 RepID=A0A484MA75_9ASTE|nr:unnamed protein product [Cuscuta campestris]
MYGSSVDESTTSDSLSATLTLPPPVKSPGSGGSAIIDVDTGVEAESGRKLPSSRFKGVVPQPNGRWGAQIYEKHQRVWLGTFNEEEEAGRVYDIAAQRFRGRDAVTNFKPMSVSDMGEYEAAFLNSHSKAEIVDMLRKHTYADELEQARRAFAASSGVLGRRNPDSAAGGTEKSRERLFEKAVTPSDVGKLNRLVIPKQQAEKHFPLQNGGAVTSKGLLLNFEDGSGKVWRFRYSYWNSSQSYVLTKGWSRFVKEKCLKAGDIVSFHRSTGPDRQLYIDWKARNAGPEISAVPVHPVQVFRLFGVEISSSGPPAQTTNNNTIITNCSGGKRIREMEFLPLLQCSKKQRIVNAL